MTDTAELIARPCPTCGYQIDRVERLTNTVAAQAQEIERKELNRLQAWARWEVSQRQWEAAEARVRETTQEYNALIESVRSLCNDEIEITPAMIRAGVEAFKPFLFEYYHIFDSDHPEIVRAVWTAMCKAVSYQAFVSKAVKTYPQPSLRPPGGAREGQENPT
jgi:hypothetical protein